RRCCRGPARFRSAAARPTAAAASRPRRRRGRFQQSSTWVIPKGFLRLLPKRGPSALAKLVERAGGAFQILRRRRHVLPLGDLERGRGHAPLKVPIPMEMFDGPSQGRRVATGIDKGIHVGLGGVVPANTADAIADDGGASQGGRLADDQAI